VISCLFFLANRELVSWMRGHESAVHSISVHTSGRFAITTSRDTAQLWNLDTFERARKLNVKSDVPIQKASVPFPCTRSGLQSQGYFQGVYCNTTDHRFCIITLQHYRPLFSHNLCCCNTYCKLPGNNVYFTTSP